MTYDEFLEKRRAKQADKGINPSQYDTNQTYDDFRAERALRLTSDEQITANFFNDASTYLDRFYTEINNPKATTFKNYNQHFERLESDSLRVKNYIESLKGTENYDSMKSAFDKYSSDIANAKAELNNPDADAHIKAYLNYHGKLNQAMSQMRAGSTAKEQADKTGLDEKELESAYKELRNYEKQEDLAGRFGSMSYDELVGTINDPKRNAQRIVGEVDQYYKNLHNWESESEQDMELAIKTAAERNNLSVEQVREIYNGGKEMHNRATYASDALSNDDTNYIFSRIIESGSAEQLQQLKKDLPSGKYYDKLRNSINLAIEEKKEQRYFLDVKEKFPEIDKLIETKENGDEYFKHVYKEEHPEEYSEYEKATKLLAAYEKQGVDIGKYKQYGENHYERIKNKAIQTLVSYGTEQNPIGASLASPAINMFGSIGDVPKVIRAAFDDDYYYDPKGTASYTASNIRSTVSRKIDNPGWEFLYNSGMSMSDSAIGIAANYIPVVGQFVSSAMFFSSAGVSAANEVVESGGTPAQAAWTMLAHGGAELVFEKISLEKLNALQAAKNVKGAKQIITNILKQSFTETSEEVATTLANTLTDQMINGDLSAFARSKQAYIDEGLSEKEATAKAVTDWWASLGMDAAGGALSGGVFGALGSTKAHLSYRSAMKNTTVTLGGVEMSARDALKAAPDHFRELAQKLTENEGFDVKQLTEIAKDASEDGKARTLADSMERTIRESGKEKITAADVENLLNELYKENIDAFTTGEHIKSAAAWNAIDKLTGDQENELNDSDKAILDKVKNGAVLSEDERQAVDNLPNLARKIAGVIKADPEKIKSVDFDEKRSNQDKFKASDNGKTFVNDKEFTGGIEISSVDPRTGTITYDLNYADGTSEQLTSDKIRFATPEEAQLNERAASYNTDQARAFVENYHKGQDVDNYAREWNLYSNYGRLAINLDTEKMNVGGTLTNAQKIEAYQQGLNSRIAHNQAQTIVESVNGLKPYTSQTQGAFAYNVPSSVKLTKAQMQMKSFFRDMSAVTGLNIEIFQSKTDAHGNYIGENGSYDPSTNTLRVDINAGLNHEGQKEAYQYSMLNTVAHELTHVAKQGGKYENLREAVIAALGTTKNKFNELVEKKFEELRKNEKYAKLSDEQLMELADEEVICDSCETMLHGNSDFFENLYKKDKKLTKSFVDAIKRLVERVKSFATDRYANTEYGKALLQVADDLYSQIQQLWNEAVESGLEAANNQINKNDLTKRYSNRYSKQGGKWSKALTGAEWSKYNNAITSGVDAGLRISDNSVIIECEEGNIYDYKYIIYDDSFEDKPIETIYAIGGLNHNVPEAKEIANYINGVEERRYAKQKILKELLKRHAEKFGYVLRRYNPQTGRFNHVGGTFTQNRADFVNQSNRAATFTAAGQIKFSERVTQTDTDYLSAVERGDMETAQKMVDEAARAAGYDLHLYHGSKSGGGFTVFKGWQYFTKSKPYAERYTQRDTGKGLYNVFVKSSRMFDTRNATDRAVFEQYRNEYGMSELQEYGLPDWTDGYDLSEIIEENSLDYDGIVLDEGGDLVNGKPVSRGESYVIRSSEQIKSADPVTYDDDGKVIPLSERFKTDNADIRYQDRDYSVEPEEYGDLFDDLFTDDGDLSFGEEADTRRAESIIDKMIEYDAENAAYFLSYSAGEIAQNTLNGLKDIELSDSSYLKIAKRFYKGSTIRMNINSEEIAEQVKLFVGLYDDGMFDSFDAFLSQIVRWNEEHLRSDKFASSENMLANAYNLISYIAEEKASYANNVGEMSEKYAKMERASNKAKSEVKQLKAENQELNRSLSGQEDLTDYYRKETYNSRKEISNLQMLNRQLEKAMAKAEEQAKKRLERMKSRYDNKLDEIVIAAREKRNNDLRKVRNNYKKDKVIGVMERRLKGLVKALDNSDPNKRVKQAFEETAKAMLEGSRLVFFDNLSAREIVRGDIPDNVTPEERAALKRYHEIIGDTDHKLTDAERIELRRLRAQLKNVLKNERNDYNQKQAEAFETGFIEMLDKLENSYALLKTSGLAYIRDAYDDNIVGEIQEFKAEMRDVKLKDINLEQLEDYNTIIRKITHTISNANKLFTSERSYTETAQAVMREIEGTREQKEIRRKIAPVLGKTILWNNFKPVYAVRYIGSETLEKIYWQIQNSELVWIDDITGARDFLWETKDKYDYKHFDMKFKKKFTAANGAEFELTKDQIFAVYVLSRRGQALQHLLKGGFTFPKGEKAKGGRHTGSTSYPLNAQIINEITAELSDNERQYAEALQKYLSEVMAKKGNEVSMKLYGVELFNEDSYWSIQSSSDHRQVDTTEQKKEFMRKNAGFTKATVRNASNPIVLNGFEEGWADHVNEMSLYHATTLPIEDFSKVLNYNARAKENETVKNVRTVLNGSFGQAATDYFNTFLQDINGGIQIDSRDTTGDKLISRAKKASVMLNFSVILQQPMAAVRAMNYISPKYFAAPKLPAHSKKWAQLKKYAKVASIKEMGIFDVGMGQGAVEWINTDERAKLLGNGISGFVKAVGSNAKDIVVDSAYRDEVLSRGASYADEVAWLKIWNAVQHETKAKYGYALNSEKNLIKSGERFNEVIHLTQVYDSVLTRSHVMRSKSTFLKMTTAFMAEPTTIVNMAIDAGVQLARKKNARPLLRAGATLVVSMLLNNLLKSIPGAMRDDKDEDDDGDMRNKYWQAFGSNVANDFNPMNYFPMCRDIMSLIEGYHVDRMDMSLFSNVINAANKVLQKGLTAETGWNLAGRLFDCVGIPLYNVVRDVRSVINTYNHFRPTEEEINFQKLSLEIESEYQSKYDKYWSEGVEEDKCESKAKSAAKSKMTKELKERYLKALKQQDSDTKYNIRIFMRDSGYYDSLNDVDKALENWRKGQEESEANEKRADERKNQQ